MLHFTIIAIRHFQWTFINRSGRWIPAHANKLLRILVKVYGAVLSDRFRVHTGGVTLVRCVLNILTGLIFFCFALFCSVLHFCLSCLVLSCLVLSCLVLSCLVLSCLVLSCPVLSCLVLSCLVLSCLVLSCLVRLSCLVLSCLVLSRLVLSCLARSCLALPSFLFFCLAVEGINFASYTQMFRRIFPFLHKWYAKETW